MVGALDRPTRGTVLVDGVAISDLPESQLVGFRRQHVGFIFQAFGLMPILSAAENVEVPLRLVNAEPRDRDRRVHELLELVGLGGRANHRPHELSGGEQQRVAIARALANRPGLLLADEPTGQLDSQTGRGVMALLRDLMLSEGVTAIVATHDPALIELADRVIELRDGQRRRRQRAGDPGGGRRGLTRGEGEQRGPAPEEGATRAAGILRRMPTQKLIDLETPVERAFLLAVDTGAADGWNAEDSLAELANLALTAGAEVVGAEWQNRRHVDPHWYVGKGKAEDLVAAKSETGFDLLVADDELSPTQQKTLEDLVKTKVIDRSRLILDIFAQHARTHEGRLQVELAQLEYQLPRLTKLWTHLSRTQGGIGSRGPGESQLETDRRIIRDRIKKMKERVDDVRKARETAARGRDRRLMPTVGIVGYTNSGKSTLLNALVGSTVTLAEDKLFATLDPRAGRSSSATGRPRSSPTRSASSTSSRTSSSTPSGRPWKR